jgi:hypothetical protein
MPSPRWLGLSAVCLALAWGCDGTPPASTSNTEATVSGTITVNGKPATEGEVSFDPSNINRRDEAPRSAPIGKDGSYTVKTLVGDNRVNISSPSIQADRQISTTDLIYDVKPGENTYDIVIPAPQP